MVHSRRQVILPVIRGPYRQGVLVKRNGGWMTGLYRVIEENGHRARVFGLPLDALPWFLVAWMTVSSDSPQRRKSVIADVSASSLLALIEVGFLMLLLYLGLLDAHRSLRLPSDYLNYEPMARNLFSSDPAAHHAPFCWRVLTPWLVYGLTRLGVSLQGGFMLVTVVSLCGAVIGVYILLRLSGATLWQALAVALLVQTQYTLGILVLWDYERTDPLSYLLLIAAFILYWQGRPRWLLVVLALAALNRETALFAVAAFAGEQVIHRDWQQLKAYLPAYIVPILIIVGLHLAIHPIGDTNLLTTIRATWSLRSNLVGRGSTNMLFGSINASALNIYHLTINAFGLLLPLLILQAIHPPFVTRRPVVWIFLVCTALQIVLAIDNERLMFIAFPVVALAAWHELRRIALLVKLPMAAIGFFLVAVQGIFLIGQFYKMVQDFSFNKTSSLLKLHWLNMLWLGSLLILIVVAVGALVWVIGSVFRKLYRRVQVG